MHFLRGSFSGNACLQILRTGVHPLQPTCANKSGFGKPLGSHSTAVCAEGGRFDALGTIGGPFIGVPSLHVVGIGGIGGFDLPQPHNPKIIIPPTMITVHGSTMPDGSTERNGLLRTYRNRFRSVCKIGIGSTLHHLATVG